MDITQGQLPVAMLRILLGLVLLLLGRKLFWLFVGTIGFIFGIEYAAQYLAGQPNWLIVLIALVIGFIGAVLAIFLQRLAIGAAGFIAGGYIVVSLLNLWGFSTGQFSWVLFLSGGIVGGVLVVVLFDWALVILSSCSGATFIVQGAQLDILSSTLLFLALATAGILMQSIQLQKKPDRPPS